MTKHKLYLLSLSLSLVLLCFSLIVSPVSAYYTNMPASVVIGQPDFTSGSVNQGGSTGQNTLNAPLGSFSDGTRLFVADFSNSRGLIWNSIPTKNNTPADIVLGQPDFVSSTANNGGVYASSLSNPYYVYSNGTHRAATG